MASLVSIPNPATHRMSSLFENNNFEVPLYQRNYAWGKQEVGDFWNDLIDLINGNRDSHFFGQIVTFNNNKNKEEVIDGQQRITTSSIFLAVMRDLADDIRKKQQAILTDDLRDLLRDIHLQVKKYLRGEQGEEPSLVVQANATSGDTITTQQYFFDLTHSNIRPFRTSPEQNMKLAYDDLSKKLQDQLSGLKTWPERIRRLSTIFDAFISEFYVVVISAPNRQDAFIIFETLNSRGKDLMPSDIIKNHLMALSKDNIDRANQKWSEFSRQLNDDSTRITRFIRTYWAARQRLVVESSLYRSLSQYLKNSKDADEFLDDLITLSQLYSVLESPRNPVANSHFFTDSRLTQQIDILDRLNVLLYYPILLSMYKRNYQEKYMLIVTQKIISVFVRHRTISNDGTNNLETGFATIAQKIYNSELKDVESIRKLLDKNLMKTDSETLGAFQNLSKEGGQRGQKKWTLVYLLAELNDEDDYDSVFASDNYQPVHISEEVSVDLINYIGNWTLIEKSLADKYQNATSNEKRAEILRSSNLPSNEDLAHLVGIGWNDDQIHKRQQALGDQSVVVW